MELKTHEIYNEETDSVETIEIWGYCHYCHGFIEIGEKWEIHRKSLYHKDCWDQMRR